MSQDSIDRIQKVKTFCIIDMTIPISFTIICTAKRSNDKVLKLL
jgi:hypothetical protein